MSKSKLDHASPEANEGRVREFARIERETAPETTDPRVMAMVKGRKEPPAPVERYLRAERETKG